MTIGLLAVQFLNGLQYGVILFLIAAGLTIVFGVMDFINIAHGVLYMVGAYLAAAFSAWLSSFWLGIALAVPSTSVVGLALELLVFRHLYGRNHLDQVLATFAVLLFLDEMVKVVFGAAPLDVALPAVLSGSIPLLGALRYPVYRVVVISAGLGVAGALYALVNHTRFGMRVRAGATNAPLVAALGVDVRLLFTAVFGLGAMLAGFAGALVAPLVSIEPGMGDNVLIVAFVIVVVGGIGSIRGAFVAAILVGLVDTLGRASLPLLLDALLEPTTASQAGHAIAPMMTYVLMAVTLILRPTGFFSAKR